MTLPFDRRYDRWEQIRRYRERCETCMYDAPRGEICCKHQCGKYTYCKECTAECRNTPKLCEK